jgi:2',3'-cyclic-nucleotide 2'-phosphodiesterase (5'-nucleotidase family)
MARQAALLRDYRRNHADTPILIVETGNELNHTEYLEQPENRRIVEAFELLGSHAVHTTVQDLRRLIRLAELDAIPRDLRSHYIASSVQPPGGAQFPVKPFVVQTVSAVQSQVGVRIGILGVGADSGGLPEPWKTITADEALKRYLPDVATQSDLVILLARLPDAELHRLAQAYPEIDVILNGSSIGKGREIPGIGHTVIVESANSGTAVGLLALEWDANGHIIKWQNQNVPLPAMLPESTPMAELAAKSQRDALEFEAEKAKRKHHPSPDP